jgi:Raf kinase inhibitor-like YbhB/YbcL family protein
MTFSCRADDAQPSQSPAPSPPLAAGAPASTTQGELAMPFQLSSAAFKQSEYIPRKYTGDGLNVSPALQWTAPPEGTKSLALICEDPDAPVGVWVHWVMYGIPALARDLPEAMPPKAELPDGTTQGVNDFRKLGYGGPAPPRGSDHRYFFRLYALDITPLLAPGAHKADLMKAMEGHVLGESDLMGRYKR